MQDERLRRSLPHAVVRLFRMLNRAHNRALAPLGLSAEQAHVLTALWVYGPMTVGKLQRLLALSSATLTGAIDRMEAQKMVRRLPSPDDGRSWLLEVAPAMNRKRRAIEQTVVEVEQRAFAALTEAQRRRLLALLEQAAATLEGD